ncbi:MULTISPECIES: hypothetical protein [Bacillus cereus group]|uniref:hypothetical protein n=1 Tax=Bacillus cereus group TaxID=86661 RepID=UPI0018CDA608|nr:MULTISPECIES: hypothetical protein [Bacillus cereus group]MBG9841373.1 hypothetical protein [Bacillus tropicus]MBG9880272.1 hypothetical protein [Bacillus tropicus]MBG9923320.1 hypothetical protein [Bacillus tropicus]MBJ8356536.1 hypothetical protein [Bacillus mycoides]MED2902596.1 hypothetical protein [Bacillus tropicus]
MKRNRLVYILLLSMLLLFSACKKETEKTQENNNQPKIQLDSTNFKSTIASTVNRDKLPFAETGGINVGIYNQNGEIEKDFNFNIEENQSLKKFISLGNLIKTERVYKMFLLVDYKQSEFKVDGRELAKDFTFQVAAGESVEVPIEIPPLPKGLHDVVFVIAKFPDKKMLDEEFRKKTDSSNLLFVRFSTVVGGDETVNNQVKFNSYGEKKTEDMLDGVFIAKENNYKRWLTQEVTKDKNLNFYTKVGNNSNTRKQYALVQFFDWEQMKFIDNKDVLFYDLEPNTVYTVKSQIPINKEKGVYDLTPILIHNPFQKITVYNQQIDTAIRVGVNVED